MSETKPFASLSPSLLARKGAARPAMRPQLQALHVEAAPYVEQHAAYYGEYPHLVDADVGDPATDNDLGWNDIVGEDLVTAPTQPEVLRQIETLASAINTRAEARSALAVTSAGENDNLAPHSSRRSGSALKEGRKAAFTLRLDAHRHLRLRLACAVENRSAQHLVSEALDLFLETMPGLEDLARRARQS